MAMSFAPPLLLFLLNLASSTQVPLQADPCSWEGMKMCYFNLGLSNINAMNFGQGVHVNEKMFAELCEKMVLPSPCYDQLTRCPAQVKANLSSFEEGYRQSRDLNCDKNALEDSRKIVACMDPISLAQCTAKNLLQDSKPVQFDECSPSKVFLKCAEEILPKSCPAEHKALTASIKRSMTASLLMLGCERSSQAGLVPMSVTIVLVASLFLMRLRAT